MEVESIDFVDFEEIELPDLLYKYRNWNRALDRRILTHREVFYSPPSKFEDELDCRNTARWELLNDEDILNKYFEDARNEHPTLLAGDLMEIAINNSANSLLKNNQFVESFRNETFKKYDLRTGVLCLTSYPKEISMWEKYALNHTGFCIGFDPKIALKDLGTAGGQVLYVDELPLVHPTKHNRMEQFFFQVFYKLKKWEFEKEYRSYKFRLQPLTDADRKIIIRPEAFQEIIIGAKMSKPNQNQLLELLPEELKHIVIKTANLKGGNLTVTDY